MDIPNRSEQINQWLASSQKQQSTENPDSALIFWCKTHLTQNKTLNKMIAAVFWTFCMRESLSWLELNCSIG